MPLIETRTPTYAHVRVTTLHVRIFKTHNMDVIIKINITRKVFLAKHDAVIAEYVQFEKLMKHYEPDSALFVRTRELHVIYMCVYMYVEAFMYAIPHYL